MSLKKLIITVIVFLGLTSLVYADSTNQLQAGSAWTNEKGSTLYIEQLAHDGLLTGTYINRAAGYGCQGIPYPVTGWVYGTAITWTTTWKNPTESCNSITSWTGFYYQGEIETKWYLVINGSSSTEQFYKGKDTFSPATTTINKSLIKK